jgi:hypothetical protein
VWLKCERDRLVSALCISYALLWQELLFMDRHFMSIDVGLVLKLKSVDMAVELPAVDM